MWTRLKTCDSRRATCDVRLTTALALWFLAGACASAPPAATTTLKPEGPTREQKMSWILRLEDHRVLHDPAPVVAPPPPVLKGQKPPVVVPPPPPPDLVRLLSDDEARIRRRAALAIGHVGLSEGVQPLVGALGDPDPEVKQMAAFALGLIGDKTAIQLLEAYGDLDGILTRAADIPGKRPREALLSQADNARL